MSARHALTAIALGRVAIGLALIAAPRKTGEAWIGETANDVRVAVFVRAVGARDLVIGAGTALALHSGSDARTWLAASAVADTVDVAATAAVRDRIPRQSFLTTAALAGSGAIACGAGAIAVD